MGVVGGKSAVGELPPGLHPPPCLLGVIVDARDHRSHQGSSWSCMCSHVCMLCARRNTYLLHGCMDTHIDI